MRRYRMLFALIALGIVLFAFGLMAAFFLPFWDYSKTYAPVIGISGAGGTLGAAALFAGMRG